MEQIRTAFERELPGLLREAEKYSVPGTEELARRCLNEIINQKGKGTRWITEEFGPVKVEAFFLANTFSRLEITLKPVKKKKDNEDQYEKQADIFCEKMSIELPLFRITSKGMVEGRQNIYDVLYDTFQAIRPKAESLLEGERVIRQGLYVQRTTGGFLFGIEPGKYNSMVREGEIGTVECKFCKHPIPRTAHTESIESYEKRKYCSYRCISLNSTARYAKKSSLARVALKNELMQKDIIFAMRGCNYHITSIQMSRWFRRGVKKKRHRECISYALLHQLGIRWGRVPQNRPLFIILK